MAAATHEEVAVTVLPSAPPSTSLSPAFCALDPAVLRHLILFLRDRDITTLAQVSRAWRVAVRDDEVLWHTLLARSFRLAPHAVSPAPSAAREEYIMRCVSTWVHVLTCGDVWGLCVVAQMEKNVLRVLYCCRDVETRLPGSLCGVPTTCARRYQRHHRRTRARLEARERARRLAAMKVKQRRTMRVQAVVHGCCGVFLPVAMLLVFILTLGEKLDKEEAASAAGFGQHTVDLSFADAFTPLFVGCGCLAVSACFYAATARARHFEATSLFGGQHNYLQSHTIWAPLHTLTMRGGTRKSNPYCAFLLLLLFVQLVLLPLRLDGAQPRWCLVRCAVWGEGCCCLVCVVLVSRVMTYVRLQPACMCWDVAASRCLMMCAWHHQAPLAAAGA